MKKLVLTLTALVLCAGAFAQEGAKNFIDRNYIETTGYARLEVAPNMIYIDITLNESDTRRTTIEQLEKTLYNTLQSLGIDLQKQLTVNNLLSDFVKRNNIQQSRSYQLLVSDAQTASLVYRELNKAGISNMTVNRTDHSDMENLRRQVKVNATQAARENAREIAQALDQKVGKALYIQDNNYNYRVYNTVMYKSSAGAEMADASMPDLEFRNMLIEANVLARFELD